MAKSIKQLLRSQKRIDANIKSGVAEEAEKPEKGESENGDSGEAENEKDNQIEAGDTPEGKTENIGEITDNSEAEGQIEAGDKKEMTADGLTVAQLKDALKSAGIGFAANPKKSELMALFEAGGLSVGG